LARKTSDAAGARSTGVPRSSAGGLRLGETNDVYEREAERVADELMAGESARPWLGSGLTSGTSLQRKCSCGGSSGADDECEECKKHDGTSLQRKATGSAGSGVVPPVVHEVLNAPGQPLDKSTRDYFEPRFGHDFSRVRVHADERAAESARAVAADAFTVGHHIVLGAGQFAPTARAGRKLLAHELTHVRQQESAMGRASVLARQPWREPKDTRCDTLCGSIESMRNAVEHLCKLAGENDEKCIKARKTRAEAEERIVLSKCHCDISKGAVNKVNQPLSEEDKKQITTTTKATAPTGPVAAIPAGTRFVLHDTGGKQTTVAAEKKRIAEHQRGERGPLDEAAAGYVTSAGDPFVARPRFFDPRRPTATEFEKRADLLSLADREKAFQKVWNATQPAEQNAALDRALAGLVLVPNAGESKKDMLKRAITERTLTPDEATSEKTTASSELGTPVPATPKKNAKPLIHTTAAWTIGELCARATAAGVKAIAVPGQEKDFTDGCSVLQPYLAARDPRLGSMTNVEILAEKGSDCNIKGTLQPFPAYDPNVYQGVTSLYLQAALQAGSFPEITTHFWVDRTAGDHCDPRCFDLNRLYGVIASTMAHPKGSTYGLKPIYGVVQGMHNVWWLPAVCGGSPPP